MKNKVIHIILFCIVSISTHAYGQDILQATQVENNLKISAGTVKRFYFKSSYVDARNIDVWVPQNFNKNKKYAVLYMQDGQMLYDASGSWNAKEWDVDETLTRLLNEGIIQDVIVVGIYNNGNKRHTEYFPQKAIEYIAEPQRSQYLGLMPEGPIADNYLKFIVEELKPFIDTTFPTYKDQKHTFIAGSSMGGLISFYALCEYPDIFGGAACLSTHWIGGYDYNTQIPDGLNEYLKKTLPTPEKHRIYFDHGTTGLDANYPEFQKLVDETMKQKNYTTENWISLEFEGDDHNEKHWAARLDKPLVFLLRKSK